MGDWREVRVWMRDEMLKRVARFKDLRGSDGSLQDSDVPECRRTPYNLIGFQPPHERPAEAVASRLQTMRRAWRRFPSRRASTSATAARSQAKGRPCTPGDANETFIAMTGRWRCEPY